jgi:import inner membrane translocase subunit TIM21
MKPPTAPLRPSLAANLYARNTTRPSVSVFANTYATQNGLGTTAAPGPKRRTVTAFNDDGFVPWNQLSGGEKAARATQQTFNFGLVMVGIVLTGGVGYFLWTDVFSPDSKISQFNRVVDRIRKDQRCLELLGDGKKITAHGEETMNKWRRARPVASTENTDSQGTQHLMMHFYVEGSKNRGMVQLHMAKRRDQSDYEYRYLFLDVKGHDRVYLENAESAASGSAKKALSLFGVKWG